MKKELTPEQKEKIKITKQKWYIKNKEKQNEASKKYREENKEELNQKAREKYPELKDKKLEYHKERNKNEDIKQHKLNYSKNYGILNKDKINERERNRLKNDILYKLKKSIRTSIGKGFRVNGYTKKSKTHEILGCSFEEFKLYLESKFDDWMNWNNKGLYNGTPEYGWDIDHIIPASNATTEIDLIQLNHYTNLQPLCSYYNRDIKKNNLI